MSYVEHQVRYHPHVYQEPGFPPEQCHSRHPSVASMLWLICLFPRKLLWFLGKPGLRESRSTCTYSRCARTHMLSNVLELVQPGYCFSSNDSEWLSCLCGCHRARHSKVLLFSSQGVYFTCKYDSFLSLVWPDTNCQHVDTMFRAAFVVPLGLLHMRCWQRCFQVTFSSKSWQTKNREYWE